VELVQRYKRPLERTYTGLSERQDTEDIVKRHYSAHTGALVDFVRLQLLPGVTRIGINNSLMRLRKRKSRPEMSFIPHIRIEDIRANRKTLTFTESDKCTRLNRSMKLSGGSRRAPTRLRASSSIIVHDVRLRSQQLHSV